MHLNSQTFIYQQCLQRWCLIALTLHTVAYVRQSGVMGGVCAELQSVAALKNNWIKWQTVCDDRERGVMGWQKGRLRGERGADKSNRLFAAEPQGSKTGTQGPQTVTL